MAFLPPSSRCTCFRFSAAFRITSTPVSREPVSVITGTSGCRTSRSPTAPPPPCTMLITPSGRPASTSNSTNRSPSSGVSVAGLNTTVFPEIGRGRDLPRRNRDREVPRRDHADHADRHAHAHVELVAQLRRRRLAEQAPAFSGHVEAHVDRLLDVAARLRLDLAHLAGHQVGELVLLLHEEIREAVEDLAPLRRGHEPPVLERRFRRRDGAVDVLGRRARERADRVARRRVDALEGLAGGRVDPLAPDVVLEGLRPRQCHGASLLRGSRPSRGRCRGSWPGAGRGSPAAPRTRRRRRPSGSPVGPLAPVDDHGDVRVVLVVLDHLVVQLVVELRRDDAIDHALIVRRDAGRRQSVRRARSPGRAGRPARCVRSTAGSRRRDRPTRGRARPAGPAAPASGVTRYWYQEMSQATVTTSSRSRPERGMMLARGSPRLFAMPPTVRR